MARLIWLKEGLTQYANDEPINNERLYDNEKPKSPIQVFHYHNDHLGTLNELTNQMDSNGNWYHESVLKEKFKGDVPNPNFDAKGAKDSAY